MQIIGSNLMSCERRHKYGRAPLSVKAATISASRILARASVLYREQHRRGLARTDLTAVLFALILFLPDTSARAATFTPIGDLPGGSFYSWATDISADGSTVVGVSLRDNGTEAFRWTRAGGMVGLGDLPGGSFVSEAHGVSANGSVIVGMSASSFTGAEAFRWTASGGMVGLGDLAGGSFSSLARAVSADGSVIVGEGTSAAGKQAIRWTAASGMVGLGDIPGSVFSSTAYDVSADGSVVVGQGNVSTSFALQEAFRWTAAGGMVGLGDFPGASFYSEARNLSDDGSIVVGTGLRGDGYHVFRWTSCDGMVALEGLGGHANDASADASVIVGNTGGNAFVWTSDHGFTLVRDLLLANGVTGFSGWTRTSALGVSDDGMTIVGYGTNPLGNEEGWVVTVPEPSSWALALLGIAGLLAAARTKSVDSGQV
jgi:probable HAF family extracellular repeat protein